jgi:hypothetical protein
VISSGSDPRPAWRIDLTTVSAERKRQEPCMLTSAPKQGLDGAMQTILAQAFGRFLLTAAALGLVAFGVFAILQSRHRRM